MKEEYLWCDRQGDSKGKECRCVCHQEDYPLPADLLALKENTSLGELREEFTEKFGTGIEPLLPELQLNLITDWWLSKFEAYIANREHCIWCCEPGSSERVKSLIRFGERQDVKAEIRKEVEKYIKQNRDKIERLDRYVLDDILALPSLKDK